MSKIDETLKKIAGATSKANTPTTSNTDPDAGPLHELPGDPECPHCHGVGYLRRDLPVGHPDFGKLEICVCRQHSLTQEVRRRLFALSNLAELRHLTFETFQPGGHFGLPPAQVKSLEIAYSTASQYAQTLNGWLLLQGGYGCGKTHLAAAIANFAVDLGVPTLFITVPDMLDALRFAYGDLESGFEERFEEIRNAGLLVMDDFGTQNATSWAQEKLFQIINYRYINRLPTVVTTNLELGDIEDRIYSRLMDGDLVSKVFIQAPDYRIPGADSSIGPTKDLTFATFDLRKNEGLSKEELQSLEKALQAARQFAEEPEGWLLLMGESGCGKTHLAAAINNYRLALGLPVYYIPVSDLLDHLRATFHPSSTVSLDRRFESVRTTALLVLDDLGAQSMTPWAREKLYQLFNHRYTHRLATVITTADELKNIDPRIRSRMLDTRLCRIMAILAPSYGGGAAPKRARRQRSS